MSRTSRAGSIRNCSARPRATGFGWAIRTCSRRSRPTTASPARRRSSAAGRRCATGWECNPARRRPKDPRLGLYERRDHRSRAGRLQRRHRRPQRDDRRRRKGGQPGHDGRRRHGDRAEHRYHPRRRADRDARALDIHVHFNSPQLVDHALASSGVTTMLGAGSAAVRPPVRPARGTSSGSCRPPRTGPPTSASTRRATAVDRNRCASRSRRAPAG